MKNIPKNLLKSNELDVNILDYLSKLMPAWSAVSSTSGTKEAQGPLLHKD
jgi:hypothetical protein